MGTFLSGSSGDPQNLMRRMAFQAARGVPPAENAYFDFRMNGGPMRISASEINRALIGTTGEPLVGLPGKRNLGGGPLNMGDVDPSNPGQLAIALNALTRYTYTDNTTWQRWAMGLREATAVPDFLAILNDNDHIPRTRIKDILMGGYDIGATPNGNYLFTAPFVAGGYDFFGAIVQTEGGSTGLSITGITRSGSTATATAGASHGLATGDTVRISGAVETEYNGDMVVTVTGGTTFTYTVSGTPATPATGTIVYEKLNSTLPVFANTWAGNWYADATDGDIYTELVSLDVDVWTVRSKVTAAASYSTTYEVKVGLDSAGNPIFVRMVDETGAPIGKFSDQIKIHLPAGGTYRAGDIFKTPKRRGTEQWEQVLNPERPISSVSTALFIDDEEVRFEGGIQLGVAWANLEAVQDTPGRQGATTRRTGNQVVTITPTREVVDLRIQQALHEGSTVSLVLDSKSDVNIGASSRPYRSLHIIPSVKAFGDMYDVEPGGTNRTEAPTLRAGVPESSFTYDGITTSGSYLHVMENDITLADIGLA